MKRALFSVVWLFLILVGFSFFSRTIPWISVAQARERIERQSSGDREEDNVTVYDDVYDTGDSGTSRARSVRTRTTSPAAKTLPAAQQPTVSPPVTSTSVQTGSSERELAPWEERRRRLLENRTNPEELEQAQQMLEQHLERVREARQKEIDQAGGARPAPPPGMGAPPVAPPIPNMFNPPVGLDTITL